MGATHGKASLPSNTTRATETPVTAPVSVQPVVTGRGTYQPLSSSSWDNATRDAIRDGRLDVIQSFEYHQWSHSTIDTKWHTLVPLAALALTPPSSSASSPARATRPSPATIFNAVVSPRIQYYVLIAAIRAGDIAVIRQILHRGTPVPVTLLHGRPAWCIDRWRMYQPSAVSSSTETDAASTSRDDIKVVGGGVIINYDHISFLPSSSVNPYVIPFTHPNDMTIIREHPSDYPTVLLPDNIDTARTVLQLLCHDLPVCDINSHPGLPVPSLQYDNEWWTRLSNARRTAPDTNGEHVAVYDGGLLPDGIGHLWSLYSQYGVLTSDTRGSLLPMYLSHGIRDRWWTHKHWLQHVQLLLQMRADPRMIVPQRGNLLTYVLDQVPFHCQFDAIKLLMHTGADPSYMIIGGALPMYFTRRPPYDVPARLDRSPLSMAIDTYKVDIIAYLIEHGASMSDAIRLFDGALDVKAINWVYRTGNTRLLETLVAYGLPIRDTCRAALAAGDSTPFRGAGGGNSHRRLMIDERLRFAHQVNSPDVALRAIARGDVRYQQYVTTITNAVMNATIPQLPSVLTTIIVEYSVYCLPSAASVQPLVSVALVGHGQDTASIQSPSPSSPPTSSSSSSSSPSVVPSSGYTLSFK